jgi:hypothetical protein
LKRADDAAIHLLFAAGRYSGDDGFVARFPANFVERDESRRQYLIPGDHLCGSNPWIAAPVRLGTEHHDSCLACWGFAHLLRAASVTLFGLYGSVSDLISIDLANAVLFTAFGLIWIGARIFDHRRPRIILLFGGALIWLVASRVPGFAEPFNARVLLSSGIITCYSWATAYEFWSGRAEPPGLTLARDLPAVRARRALSVAHAAGGDVAVAADGQSGVRERLAHGTQLRSAAVHHRDCFHPAGHGEGAHRASA